jgi:2-oxoglutarate ferredoxin oxidoreductase subunit alpha
MQQYTDFTWKIGGEAGFGIMITGAIFAKVCTRLSYNVITNTEYPSLIRGGHNNYTVRASPKKIYSLQKTIDLLVCLNQQTLKLHKNEIKKGGSIIYDPKEFQPEEKDIPNGVTLLPIPLYEIAKKNNGDIIMRNTVALGASLAFFGIDFGILKNIIVDQFEKKGNEITDLNVKTAKSGYDHVINELKISPTIFANDQKPSKIILTGNESIAIGAISSGMKFFAAYPMTPINGLITYLASHDQIHKYIYKQPEDEIAAINMAIGASYAGVRAMTATSGGGFALMNEGFSMSGITETPLVVVLGQRPGPASGLPTWTSQADLNYALSAGHGEFLRFVFAPGDPEEAYWLTKLAFNLSEKYQTPIIILVDKNLCESLFSVDISQLSNTNILPEKVVTYSKTIDRGDIVNNPDETYVRYQSTKNGISPRLFPGKGMHFTTNSYEHNESGLSTEEAEEIKTMVDKRGRKKLMAQNESFGPILYGDKKADITIVGWGTVKMAVLEAMSILISQKAKLKINYLHFNCLEPFPIKNTTDLLNQENKIVDVELNSEGQLCNLIREKTGIYIADKILKYDGRQFYPEEIISALQVIAKE